MLGAAGAIAPETLGKLGTRPAETALPWFKTGAIPPAGTCAYWADPYNLFVLEMALMGFAEHRRGWVGQETLLTLSSTLLDLGKDDKSLEDLKLKEVKNGRLAMLAILGYFVQGLVTGVWPSHNLLDHLADPVHNNILTSLNFH
ncbi:hypothetical protein C4D60_Mb10t00100 [Musa balbisiana]|uniref:Chlorophyll a-b binding protein, chloroplastic n=1 Tax=Musa balbisiana TaxID=52838 RepID=A0A4S8ITI3_MUSBA|nr:hypothetical protein C4D60_Mb10t00100 [Musa balbisiana]